MAFTTNFAFQNTPRVFHSNQMASIKGGYPSLRWQGLKPRAMQMNSSHMFQSQNATKYILKHHKYPSLMPTFAVDSDSLPLVPSLSDLITRLYVCINERNMNEVEDIISNDCLLEDSTFPHSFQGKKEVMSFIRQLVESMGENVHFRIGTVCEGGELTASIDWHLVWMDEPIPFSKGCSICQCSLEDDRLVIRKAQIITESPFKPGDLGLGLLRILASLCDEFPKAAKWFLKSPHTIFMVMLKIYNLLFAPIMDPVFAFYVIIWKVAVQLLGYITMILYFIVKSLIKMSSNGDPRTQP